MIWWPWLIPAFTSGIALAVLCAELRDRWRKPVIWWWD